MSDRNLSCPWCPLAFESVRSLCAHLQNAHPQEWLCALSMLTHALRPDVSDSHTQGELPSVGFRWPMLPSQRGALEPLLIPPPHLSVGDVSPLFSLTRLSIHSSSPLFSSVSHFSLHHSSRLLSLPRVSLRSSSALVPLSSLSLPSSSSSSSRCQTVAVWSSMGREGGSGHLQAQQGEPSSGLAWLESLLLGELERKSAEVHTAKKEKEKLRRARDDLEERNSQLKRQLSIAAEMMAGLQHEVVEKQRELTIKDRQVCELSVFLRDTALKEADAKQRLQEFIEDLLERAEMAETLLLDKHTRAHTHYIRSRSHSDSHSHSHSHSRYTPAHSQQTYLRYAHTPHCKSSGAGLNGTYQRSQSVSVVSGHAYQQHVSPDKRWPRGVKRTLSLGSCVCERGCVCGRKWCLCERGCVCVSSDEADDSWSGDTSELSLWPHTPSRDIVSQTACSFCGNLSGSPECVCVALRCVFAYLDTHTLLTAAEVCQIWRNVSRHPSLWIHLTLESTHISSTLLVNLSRWCTQTRSVTMRNLTAPRRLHESAEEHYRNTRGCLEAGLEVLLRATGRSLVELTVIDCPNILTDRCVWLASCYCRSLQTLTYRSASDPVGPEVIWALGAGCRNISSLQVAPLQPCLLPGRFGKRCLQLIGRCWPQLREVGVGGAACGVQGLASLVKSCASLKRLQLHGVCEVSVSVAQQLCREGLRCLETLEFHSTPVSPDALLHFHSMCGQLRCVLVQVSISDYFQDPDREEAHRLFNQTVNKMQALQNSILSGILHLRLGRC